MSSPRNRKLRLNSASKFTRPHVNFNKYERDGKVSYDGAVFTEYGIVMAMSDALSDLCRYDTMAGGRQYIYYENGQRTQRGLVRRAIEIGRDAMQRARMGARRGR